jgi:transcriptional regulator with XRE-family HTH domain/Zn-dependent peptidase ImmA (M78 family)
VIDAEALGQRIAETRNRAGLTQAELADAISVSRTALTKIEAGDRRVTALELARLAQTLDVRIEWFLEDPPAAIISHRNAQDPGAPSPRIDRVIERVAWNVEFVMGQNARFSPATTPAQPMPCAVGEAEALAESARSLLGLERHGPATNLADMVSVLGLMPFVLDLGSETADAATIMLRAGGATIINGVLRSGRRRLALAHELGHYLVADDYTVDWRVAEYQSSQQRESLLDRFARALLLPAADVPSRWSEYASADGGMRTAAVRIASEYRVDMATLAMRLVELHVLGRSEANKIRTVRTTRADIVELNLVVAQEMEPPALPRAYEVAVLQLYRSETISAARAVDLLLDTWDEDSLPPLPRRSEDEIWQYV